MSRMIFVNLPVADVARATAFYEAIGMTRNARFSDGRASAMTWSDTITFMLLDRAFFATFTPRPIVDATAATEVIVALSCDSRAEVDAMVEAAIAAGGGKDINPIEDLGFMYSRDFSDPDGHLFGPLWMNPEAAANGPDAVAAAGAEAA